MMSAGVDALIATRVAMQADVADFDAVRARSQRQIAQRRRARDVPVDDDFRERQHGDRQVAVARVGSGLVGARGAGRMRAGFGGSVTVARRRSAGDD